MDFALAYHHTFCENQIRVFFYDVTIDGPNPNRVSVLKLLIKANVLQTEEQTMIVPPSSFAPARTVPRTTEKRSEHMYGKKKNMAGR